LTAVRLSLAGLRHHPVLLAGVASAELVARLAPFFDVEVAADIETWDPEELRTRLAGKSAVLDACGIAVEAQLLATLPHLKAICRIGSSAAGLDLDACTRAGIIVTNTFDAADDEAGHRNMSLTAADNLIAAFGFGRHAGHPKNMLNPELRCVLGCCL
jgi:phosphoglycerate dehydrogenase-like enzyme